MNDVFSSPSVYVLFLISALLGYFGTHVIQRRVIFVDLAIAQIAAFGAVYCTYLGYSLEKNPTTVMVYSLVFAAAGGFMFAITRPRSSRVPHEAIIGIIYGVASSATLLVASRVPEGVNDLHHLLAGRIEFVTWDDVKMTAIAYSAVAAFHFFFAKRFIELSSAETITDKPSIYVKFWDSVFYSTFAVIVAKSVPSVGVLLVFTYLVIPAVIASLFFDGFLQKMIAAISIGIGASAIGSVITESQDLPRGPTIACVLGAMLLLVGIVQYIRGEEKLLRGIGTIAVYGIIIVGAWFALYSFRYEPNDLEAAISRINSRDPNEVKAGLSLLEGIPKEKIRSALTSIGPLFNSNDLAVRQMAIKLVVEKELQELYPEIIKALKDRSDQVRDLAIKTLTKIGAAGFVDQIVKFAQEEEDFDLKLQYTEMIINEGKIEGLDLLLDIMENADAELTRHEAFMHFKEHVNANVVFDHMLEPGKNAAQMNAIKGLISANKSKIRWDAARHLFLLPE